MAKYTRYKRTVDIMGKEVLEKDKTFNSIEQLIKKYPALKDSKERYKLRKHIEGYEYIKTYKHKNGNSYTTVQRILTYKGYVWKITD